MSRSDSQRSRVNARAIRATIGQEASQQMQTLTKRCAPWRTGREHPDLKMK